MIRNCLLFTLILLCADNSAQSKVNDFYSLMTSPNVNQESEFITLTWNRDNGVHRKVEHGQDVKLTNTIDDMSTDVIGRFYSDIGAKIDSLNIIDYASDTIYLISQTKCEKALWSDNDLANPPCYVSALLITGKDRAAIHWNNYYFGNVNTAELYRQQQIYSLGHPAVIESILRWDMDELSSVISRFSDNIMIVGSGPTHTYAQRVIIDDYKKIYTSSVKFPIIAFPE